MSNPLVSVIIPTYNRANYLPETLRSISQQDYRPIEVIIVDDGSDDGTEEIISQLPSSDLILRYKRIPRSGGPSRPRNIGIELAKGECVFFFDSDDLMLPDKISATVTAYSAGKEVGVGLYFTNFLKGNYAARPDKSQIPFLSTYQKFQNVRKNRVADKLEVIQPDQAFTALCSENFIGTSSVMIPHQILMQEGYRFDEALHNSEDRDLWFRMAKAVPFGYVSINGHCYRTHPEAISTNESLRSFSNRIDVLERQFAHTLTPIQKRNLNQLLRRNRYCLAYHHELKREFATARNIYRTQATENYDARAAFRLFLTYLKQFVHMDQKKSSTPHSYATPLLGRSRFENSACRTTQGGSLSLGNRREADESHSVTPLQQLKTAATRYEPDLQTTAATAAPLRDTQTARPRMPAVS